MKTQVVKIALLLLAAAAIFLASCKKEENSIAKVENPAQASKLSDLTIDQNFNWSSSIKGRLTVNIAAPTSLHTEDQEVQLVDAEGNTLERSFVKNGKAIFYLHIPQAAEIWVHYPNTGDKMAYTGQSMLNMELRLPTAEGAEIKSAPRQKSSQTFTGINLLGNSAFNTMSDVAYRSFDYKPGPIDGKWYIGSNSYQLNTTLYPGDTVLKLNLDNNGALWGQTIAVKGGAPFTISSFWNNSSRRIVVSFFDKDDNFIGYSYPAFYGNYWGGQHSGFIPALATKALIWSSSSYKAVVDDIKFYSTPTITDSDQDGIADELDEFPNDASRAYTTTFPTLGDQYLAFEDLWPYMGDFDFNDLVLKNKVVYTRNANNYLVDATFSLYINAVGAGLHNGIALNFLQNNKQAFTTSICNGNSANLTPINGLQNGFIVSPDVFEEQSSYYTNTGKGPDGTPVLIQFTVSFTPNTVSSIIPDLYLFRSGDLSHEIHLDGFAPTAMANSSLMGTGDDENGTYNTPAGLPWAIEIITPSGFSFRHPLEKTDILESYPQFQLWAETNGLSNVLWFENPISSKVY